ncbi:Putative transcriptional regulator, TetR family [Mycobacteroides abscessus subsp. bolletii]|uniref:TetR/AcrR family transcriptional regulator n=1 Tax=Mycobacteroides abscessus TaxID=36809 RepID=UPI00092C0FE5|nr:TetR/AcrR family transcriptional regulator [Mycobacteroides abscessus]SHY58467.1 Putative transcriptional regulator, TetR family [Mycobacteroides abscessus subsp. bolletii]SKQ44681.1 Putative transcriptional regulator, TetR family [Mycobacteroides abscessus subsp. bolletii]SKQ47691.1 Putative transcriptional regulator, TetR family [Mycobacteroides abscessus subsp. bolletii]SKQ53566.1 Putative transcriptional regulator, TetR family [Mycobacteroides abscessus subsp. bolletii]SKU29999.1 Putati
MQKGPTSGAASRRPWAERHAHLLDAAEQLFFERGFAAVSLSDIAQAAGVTKPIAYRHFKTKDGAYLACARRAQADFAQALVQRADPTQAVREQFAAAADLFYELLETHPERWELIYGSAAVLPAESRDELSALRLGNIETTYALITKDHPDIPKLFAEGLSHAMSGAAERLGHWWRSRPDLDRQHMVDIHVEIFYAAVAPYLGSRSTAKR